MVSIFDIIDVWIGLSLTQSRSIAWAGYKRETGLSNQPSFDWGLRGRQSTLVDSSMSTCWDFSRNTSTGMLLPDILIFAVHAMLPCRSTCKVGAQAGGVS